MPMMERSTAAVKIAEGLAVPGSVFRSGAEPERRGASGRGGASSNDHARVTSGRSPKRVATLVHILLADLPRILSPRVAAPRVTPPDRTRSELGQEHHRDTVIAHTHPSGTGPPARHALR